MRIVVFGGTTEGREFSKYMAERGAEVTVCVATDYGREEQGDFEGVTVLTGRMNSAEMSEVLRGAVLCVDATHPYAAEVTKNVLEACEISNIQYKRLLRKSSDFTSSEEVIIVESTAEACEYLSRTDGNILIAAGAKEISNYSKIAPTRLFPRILPTHEGISACEALGIPHRNIIAMQGPFTLALNEALISQYNISYLVTKESGKIGGFTEKLQAVRDTGIKMLLIRRPLEEHGESFDEIAAYCGELLCREQ